MDSAKIYFDLCNAADEYTIFRNAIQVQPGPMTAGQLEAALQRADKIVGLLKQLRQREAITFIGAEAPPPRPAEQPPSQAGTVHLADGPVPAPPGSVWFCQCGAKLVIEGPPGTLPKGSCPACGTGFTQNVTKLQPTKTAWQCDACKQTLWAEGNVPPESCPHCGRRWR